MTLNTRFWGVRGSIPSPGPHTARVGGNTSCVEIRFGDETLILDAGTGLRRLGDAMLRRGGPVNVNFLLSHVHWDHIQGLPFFAPIFRADSVLRIHGRQPALETGLRRQMSEPSFPVPFDQLPSNIELVGVEPGSIEIGAFSIECAALNHPDGVLAYRIEAGGRSVVYATDTEHYADGEIDNALVELSVGADILIYDAQYTVDEYEGRDGPSREGWGHSTWIEGVRIAREAGVRKLVLFHHDPSHDDDTVDAIERAAAAELAGTIAAREGTEIALEALRVRAA